MAMLIRITIIVITTMSSTNVKPRSRARGARPPRFCLPYKELPIGIWFPIRVLVGGFGVDVKNILAAPTAGGRVVLIAAQSPLVLIGERVARNAAQELHQLAVRALRQFLPRHQNLQGFGVTVATGLGRAEIAHIAVVLVPIDRVAHVGQSG